MRDDFKDEPLVGADANGVPSSLRSIRPQPTDAQKAEDYRARLKPVLEQAASLITEARREGLIIGFNLMPDQFGIQRVGEISVTKPL